MVKITIMAFTEANSNEGGPAIAGPFGLPTMWERLKRNECPRCGHDLEEFPHMDRWTCYTCGIKIPTNTKNGESRAYFIGLIEFKDETPF